MEIDDTFRCNLLIFKVENRIFQVPKEPFEQYSSIFKDMFNLPYLSSGGDQSDVKPIHLEGILKDDFHAFLSVLSSLHFEAVTMDKETDKIIFVIAKFPLYEGLNKQHWIAVLRLSQMWGFDEVRIKAIQALHVDSTLDMLERLKLGHEFLLRDWARLAYRHLLTRDEELIQSEVPWLPSDFVANIALARRKRTEIFFLRVLGGEIPLPDRCLECGDPGTLRMSFENEQTPLTSIPMGTIAKLHCISPPCHGSSFTIEQVLRRSKNVQTGKSVLVAEGDLDRLIDAFLIQFF